MMTDLENSSSSSTPNFSQKKVHKIVLTGGPCGGKSISQERIAIFFERIGFKIYRSPEITSILFRGGVNFSDVLAAKQLIEFQENVLTVLTAVEDSIVQIAEKLNEKCIILFDRGAMDGLAYIDETNFRKILEHKRLDMIDICDRRYDLVIFLESAAINAEKYYVKTLNRTESLNLAKELDSKTRQAWVGHPNLRIISNNTCENFEDKLVAEQVGVNIDDKLATLSIKRKYLVKLVDPNIPFPPYREFIITNYFLKSAEPNVRVRITKRDTGVHTVYTHTQYRINDSVETKMQIAKRQFEAFMKHVDVDRNELTLIRRCFVCDEQYYEMDFIQHPVSDLKILEMYTAKKPEDIRLPKFLKIDEEITNDERYSYYALSKKSN